MEIIAAKIYSALSESEESIHLLSLLIPTSTVCGGD